MNSLKIVRDVLWRKNEAGYAKKLLELAEYISKNSGE